MKIFGSYAGYYDLLYSEKDYEREAAYIYRALRDASPNARKVLEFGSGTGRHGSLLADHGFDVVGIEGSEDMATRAKLASVTLQSSNSGSFDCIHGDIRTTDIGFRFDAVFALFHVISYQTTNEDLLNTFHNAWRHLNPKGIFLFDVWHGPAVLGERPSIRLKRVQDDNILLTRVAEPELDSNAGTVTVHYTILVQSKVDSSFQSFSEDHKMRYLFPTEIDLIAKQTGFVVERSEEFMTQSEPSDKTWGVLYVLRKEQ